MQKYFMLIISDCATVAHCEMCNALNDEIKCIKCKPGFSLIENICEGITLGV